MEEETKEDWDEDVDIADEISSSAIQAIYLKRRKAIPSIESLIKKSIPSKSLPYLIASNLATFIFYSRYYNGQLLDIDPLKLSAVLITQLLSIES